MSQIYTHVKEMSSEDWWEKTPMKLNTHRHTDVHTQLFMKGGKWNVTEIDRTSDRAMTAFGPMCTASLGKDVKNTTFQNLNIRAVKMTFKKQGKSCQKREN